jgi:hypothetical protein
MRMVPSPPDVHRAGGGRRRPAEDAGGHKAGPVQHPEADKILAALQVFPSDNPRNDDISSLPVHPDSEKLIVRIGAAKSL